MDTLILRGNTAHGSDKYKFWDPLTAQGRPIDQTTIKWREKPSGMWHSVTGQIVTDISKNYSAFICRVQQSKVTQANECTCVDNLTVHG